jgi:hypothetical protein
MTTRWEDAREMRVLQGRSPMSSTFKMAIFVVLGSAIMVGALMIANYLNAAAG